MRVLFLVALMACNNDVDPRVIKGGGVGDGSIDGEVNVFVIEDATDQPIAGATVEVDGRQQQTSADGLVTFKDVDGPQTIAVKASDYRSAVWNSVDGANVTIPLRLARPVADSATLAGTIAGWESLVVPTGHLKAALVRYSWSTKLGDAANNLMQTGGNICAGQTCNWNLVSRTGTVSVIAAIVDRDPKGNLDPSDDTSTIIGWAYKTGITVEKGVNQSGLVLAMVEAGNLVNVTIDKGTPPAALTNVLWLVGVELSVDETVQLPAFINADPTTLLAPNRTVFGGTSTYRLTAIAQTTAGDTGAQSIVLRQRLMTTALAADTWLNTPTGVTVTRTSAAWQPVAGAKLHSAAWADASGGLLEITVFDPKQSAVDVPALVALPTSGTLAARIQAIGADFDINDFSLEDDSDQLWGVSAQPVTIP